MHFGSFSQRLIALGLCACLGSTLLSCGTTQTKPASSNAPSPLAAAKSALIKAEKLQLPEREHLMLTVASLYHQEGNIDRARKLLVSLSPDKLDDKDYTDYTNLFAEIALNEGSLFIAHNLLTKPRLEQLWAQMDPQAEIMLRNKRAQVFELMHDPALSIAERIQIASITSDAATANDNQNSLWQTLMHMDLPALQQGSISASSDTARGWYALASIAKNMQIDLQQQQNLIAQWQQTWVNHPAHDKLPNDLQLLHSLIEAQPKRVALLLPQQGKLADAGQAVSDGFFAAYYEALASGRQVPEIRQYDSTGDIIATYEQAIADGAELIIGPLDKDKVTELSLMPGFKVPVLALNYPEPAPAETIPGFYQFGLAVEDEARQVARQAFSEGHRQAMIIVPEQDWSQRSANAFAQEWEQLGGVIVNQSLYRAGTNYSTMVKDALLVDQSKTRALEIQNLLGTKMETQPRSRGDVDMIFLIATPSQARQIKPTFAFHYAGNIPVYSTGQVYSGDVNPKADRDLNGIRFNTMPWLFDKATNEKLAIKKSAKSASVYDRLQALGVDAFRLYARLPQLAQVPEMRINGATGTLKMLQGGRIEREQIWARFVDGKAKPLPMMAVVAPEANQ